jgi:hypothetical protein
MKTADDLSYNADEIGVYCDRCDYQTKKSIGWLRGHTQVECVACGNIINVESKNFR